MMDGFHNDGPLVAILDIENDGEIEIFHCFRGEDTYIYSFSGKRKSSLFLFYVAEDLNNDGFLDLVVDEKSRF